MGCAEHDDETGRTAAAAEKRSYATGSLADSAGAAAYCSEIRR